MTDLNDVFIIQHDKASVLGMEIITISMKEGQSLNAQNASLLVPFMEAYESEFPLGVTFEFNRQGVNAMQIGDIVKKSSLPILKMDKVISVVAVGGVFTEMFVRMVSTIAGGYTKKVSISQGLGDDTDLHEKAWDKVAS